ncbi:uncharacterized protein KQ657_000517 [Scheffersomyces spartinae]|uniref:UNC-45/Cro1/She4 central domain-containing protein n=1 Tax=Scheffersomyces spartinae TaxID=45513 RepID=A0A9P7VAH1_9ASCO|nr:uncharacterized protein KQ657_000517 [Scheffersomyces spartinae]KAG7193823.1 hypothetical protein KQ657_000517 [Scheffersomyces spartinae]
MSNVDNGLALLLLEVRETLSDFLRGDGSQLPLDDTKTQLVAQLKQLAQSKKDATYLYNLYKEDPRKFLEGLRLLGNLNGTVLVQILANCDTDTVGSEPKVITHDIAVNALHYALEGSIDFYLKLYISITGTCGLGDVEDCVQFWPLLNDFVCNNRDVHSMILVITLKYIDLNKKPVHALFSKYLQSVDTSLDNKIVAMTNFFSIFPDIVIPLYTLEATKDAIIEQTVEMKRKDGDKTHIMIHLQQMLKLLNASQISEECRVFNLTYYFDVLLQGWKMANNAVINVQSAVCLAKLYNLIQRDKLKLQQISLANLSLTLVSYICEQDSYYLNIAIEGLAYITLSKTHRQQIRDDVDLIDKLVDILRTSASTDHSLGFGVLTIFTHLSDIRIEHKGSKQAIIDSLKNVASPSGVKDDQESKENIEEIYLFNKDLTLNYNIVSIIKLLNLFSNAVLSKTYSQSTKDLTVTLLKQLATAREKPVKEAIAKNGGLDLIMDYLVSSSEFDKESLRIKPKRIPGLVTHYFDGCRALSKLLIAVDPSTAFKQTYEARNAVPFISELLYDNNNQQWTPDKETTSEQESVHIYPLDKFESLLALTNLATIDTETRTLIIKMTFEPYVNNLLLSDNLQIRKGAIELISNLIVEPLLLAKFFNIEGSKANYERLELLIRFLDSEDESTQIAVAGLLVNACEVSEMICGVLLSDEKIRSMLFDSMVTILEGQSDEQELILRIVYLIQDVVYVAVGNHETKSFVTSNSRLQSALSITLQVNKNNKEIVGLVILVLRMLR